MNNLQRAFAANLFMVLGMIGIFSIIQLRGAHVSWEGWVTLGGATLLSVCVSIIFVCKLGDPKVTWMRRKIIRLEYQKKLALRYLKSYVSMWPEQHTEKDLASALEFIAKMEGEKDEDR